MDNETPVEGNTQEEQDNGMGDNGMPPVAPTPGAPEDGAEGEQPENPAM